MSPALEKITPEIHKAQIDAYSMELSHYQIYADVLKRILERARALAVPAAFVQSRAKTLSSFAEKCVRKYRKPRPSRFGGVYDDPVHQFTDLCGARVIVQSLLQVQAVCQFIETNFDILEKDDKVLQLSESTFGYRDMHYIIQLLPERHAKLGISAEEQREIGHRWAEIQVRTWLQHAWADSLHDRIYKSSLEPSPAIRRSGALLAALLEEGDRNVDAMAEELDGMIANYTAFASRQNVNEEIDIQRLILQNEPEDKKKPGLALKLARLLEACGDYAGVVELLEPHSELTDANRGELLQSLGFALCKQHKVSPKTGEFQRGLRFLETARDLCNVLDLNYVPDLRRGHAIHARVLSRLGWAYAQVAGQEHKSRERRFQAHEQEPSNPYYLADMLGFEMYLTRQTSLPATLRTALREAIKTCRDHAANGIELPYSYFTTGQLSLLLEQPKEALGYYARGVRQYLYGEQAFPADVFEEEMTWLQRLHFGSAVPPDCQVILDLLDLAGRVRAQGTNGFSELQRRVLIIAGGAASMAAEILVRVRPLLEVALRAFSGKVISGGTVVGIPGLVGEIAAELQDRGCKPFELVGYLPEHLPQDSPRDNRYDRFVVCGHDRFSAEQILQCWKDLLDEGVHPQEVMLLGFGGGPLSAVDYRVALSLGASVAIVAGTGGAADELMQDDLWSSLPTLIPLVSDAASVWAYVAPPTRSFGAEVVEEMAQEIHESYRASNTKDLRENMQPWPKLQETYRRANREQARFAIQILEACGFGIRQVETPNEPTIFQDFTQEEIERMAELEHGRWNVDRLRDQWRPGPRDNAKKRHDCLVPWAELPDNIKQYDRDAVANFPTILAKAGLEVYRQ